MQISMATTCKISDIGMNKGKSRSYLLNTSQKINVCKYSNECDRLTSNILILQLRDLLF